MNFSWLLESTAIVKQINNNRLIFITKVRDRAKSLFVCYFVQMYVLSQNVPLKFNKKNTNPGLFQLKIRTINTSQHSVLKVLTRLSQVSIMKDRYL